jgi:hypothetical protein
VLDLARPAEARGQAIRQIARDGASSGAHPVNGMLGQSRDVRIWDPAMGPMKGNPSLGCAGECSTGQGTLAAARASPPHGGAVLLEGLASAG